MARKQIEFKVGDVFERITRARTLFGISTKHDGYLLVLETKWEFGQRSYICFNLNTHERLRWWLDTASDGEEYKLISRLD
jgi:hypothetical protein